MSETKKKPTSKLPTFANVLLVESTFEGEQNNPVANFTGIPTDESCPFLEIVFDPVKKVLGIISKHKKPQFHFVPKLDTNGAPKPNKHPQMSAAVPYAQERVMLDTYHEYYIRNTAEINMFLEMYVMNKTFDWKAYLK